jgi:hypothetical protein
MWRGNCALLPMAPTKSKRTIAVAVTAGTPAAFPCRLSYESEPNDGVAMIKNIASINPTSPTRLATNAFLPAVAALGFSNQNEISRYEQSPTPSHPRNVTNKFSPNTRMSMAPAKRLRYAKKRL